MWMKTFRTGSFLFLLCDSTPFHFTSPREPSLFTEFLRRALILGAEETDSASQIRAEACRMQRAVLVAAPLVSFHYLLMVPNLTEPCDKQRSCEILEVEFSSS